MRTRPLLLVLLGLAVAGLVAYLVIPREIGRRDRAARADAEQVFAATRPPVGAVETPSACHGSEDRRCYHVARDVEGVVGDVEAALRVAYGRAPERHCDDLTLRTGRRVMSCNVGALTGHGHAVVAFVEPHMVRGGGVDGTDVRLYVD